MKTNRLVCLFAAAAMLPSCWNGELSEPVRSYAESEVPVLALPYLDEGWTPVTKAVPEIDESGLQAAGFGVYAFYTGTEEFSNEKDLSDYASHGLVMNNREFYYADSRWNNRGDAEFWPTKAGENLSLFAYAPYDVWKDAVVYDGKVPSVPYVAAEALTADALDAQEDLLWGTNTSGLPHRNVEKDDYDPEGTVDFHFRHALAKVRFTIQGSLPGETRTQTGTGSRSVATGSAGAVQRGETTSRTNTRLTTGGSQYVNIETGVRAYYAVQTETQTESYVETRSRTNTENVTGATFSVSGQRYLIERITMKGFHRQGSLLLNNATPYYPAWTGIQPFSGETQYVLDGSNVLTQSLRYVDAAMVQANYSTYTGIRDTPTDLMSGYFLYAIPRDAEANGPVALTIDYHRLNAQGTLTVNRNRTVEQEQTRTVTRTRTRTRRSEYVTVNRVNNDYLVPTEEAAYAFTEDFGEWSSWSAWSNPGYGDWADVSVGEWQVTSETLSGSTVNYDGDPAPHLSGTAVTSLQGSRSYTVNVVVAGDRLEIDVVPQPWEVSDFSFDYGADMNEVIQSLTYDSSYIDYADPAGNVYINNRMGKFFFKLGSGKYSSWQATLVTSGGSPGAFGFTDEDGNWLYEADGVTRVSSIRSAIDPDRMNYIYVKAVDNSSSVTNSAKLRIYYIDATGDAVVALNLVNLQGVTEWNIVQNAN